MVANSNCLVVEDVITTGSSVLETCQTLKEVRMKVTHAVVLLDREQGGKDNIEKEGIDVMSVMTISQLLTFLLNTNNITLETVSMVKEFIGSNSYLPLPPNLNYITPQSSSTVSLCCCCCCCCCYCCFPL